MISDKNKMQEGGDGSSNIQAENVNVYNGLSYTEVKEIANDIFKDNFLKVKNEAAKIASERAEEISEQIISRVNKTTPNLLEEFSKPAMQEALFIAQKEYAKSGDKDLGELLVDIIVDRAKAPQRNILQIMLDESLQVASKLTISQLDTLTFIFLITRARKVDLRTFEEFKEHFKYLVCPFIDNLSTRDSDYQYLEYLRCGNIRAVDFGGLERVLIEAYRGFFSNGFTYEDLKNKFTNPDQIKNMIVKCLHDQTKLQFSSFDKQILEIDANKAGLDKISKEKLKSFFLSTTKSPSEVRDILLEIDPKIETALMIWQGTPMGKFQLSGVGVTLAHANFRRRTGKTMDLSIWIK